ncbi:DUF998 domain-containing protein [Halosegnis marinus]|uniref:DUF998 domain-containing protein n=1 Tax=Halosegnis marinus TaxID=3034023 RepID=A0ABD5ZJR6_9EURY|nr:DUF998 domain-containing protein [Halosegnis sp. DT85]
MNTTQRSVAVGAAGIAVSFVAILAATATAPWFSWADNALSDLGVSDAPEVWLFNLGLIAAGLLGLGFLPALRDLAANRVQLAALVPFGVAMVGVAGVGVFPSGQPTPHAASAITAYLGFMLAPVLWGVGDALRGATRNGLLSVADGVLHLGFWLLWAFALTDAIPGLAVPEFVGSTLFNAWALWVGYRAWTA